jgi:hypothetical protein
VLTAWLRDQSKRGSCTSRRGSFAGAKEEEKAAPLRPEDVTKLQEIDFFVSKLIFSVSFGRKTKKSQPLGMTGLGALALISTMSGCWMSGNNRGGWS